MIDNRSAAEVYRDMIRKMRADVGFREVNRDGTRNVVYRGPRGEAGPQPIYRGQKPDNAEDQD
jgi:hypothetical protein